MEVTNIYYGRLAALTETETVSVLYCTALYYTETVPRREEGSTGNYQHDYEVEGTPETECWYFTVLPDSSHATDSHSHSHSYVQCNSHVQT